MFVGSCAPNSLHTSSSSHLPNYHSKMLFSTTINKFAVPQHNLLWKPSITTMGFALIDQASPLSSFQSLVADPVLSKVLVSLFLGLAHNPQPPIPEVHLNIISLATLILSISLSNHDTDSEPGPPATPPHAHPQVLFVNATSLPTLTTNNITPSPSCHVHTLKLSSMDEDEDILSLLLGLPSTLAILHHLAATTTHTQQATMSHHHTTIHMQQASSCNCITMHTRLAPSCCCVTIYTWWALSCCHITTRTLTSPLHSLPHGYLYMS